MENNKVPVEKGHSSPNLENRKDDHININLEKNVLSSLSNGFENYHFIHEALPELNLADIDTSQMLFNRLVKTPLLISSMTGGTEKARIINFILAEVAQLFGLAMGVGSQRAAIENPSKVDTFQIRRIAPDILLFANLGAVQLNYGYSLEQYRRAVEMIEADALILHLNPLQEAVQPEGDTNFSGLLKKIEYICRNIGVPVIAKEVGWGISAKTAGKLFSAGISVIDIAGAGGTSWSNVEKFRAKTKIQERIAQNFHSWGISTADSLIQIKQAYPDSLIIASGGLQNGIDICKSLTLGASLGGLAGKFLKAAADSIETTIDLATQLSREIKICMFATGSKDLTALHQAEIIQKR